ncbi:hypothetical protein KIN20_017327 [Parelaphostrongylus tenuis]|uniref:Endonuclease-reverse transcriptase n=1 Tax=Parelaphostrongylus tenuis TaxID=148309 RepID=A0AAD5MIE7_PARTN|nr:hypothetical protein KIN20_017327 [Parelaphostrongylus tenuis]
MMNDLAPELSRRKRAAWGTFKSIEDVVKRTKNIRLRAHLFDSTIIPALTYAAETWSLRKQDERSLAVIERAVERSMLGVSRISQMRQRIRTSDLRQRSKIRDAVLHARISKIRWAGHVMRFNDNRWTRAVTDWIPRDVKRSKGRPLTRWSDFFTKAIEESMMLSESLERGGPTGLLLHAIGKMEELLVPARVTRRSTGQQVIQVKMLTVYSGKEGIHYCGFIKDCKCWTPCISRQLRI